MLTFRRSTLKMEAVCFFETLVPTYQTTARRHNRKSQRHSLLVGKIQTFYVLLLISGRSVTNCLIRLVKIRCRYMGRLWQEHRAGRIGSVRFVPCILYYCTYKGTGRLQRRRCRGLIADRGRYLAVLHGVPIATAAHPASYPIVAGGASPG